MNRYNRFKEPRREHRPPPLSPTSPPQMPSPGVPPMNGDQVMLLQQVQVHQQQVDTLLQQYKVQTNHLLFIYFVDLQYPANLIHCY